MAELMFGLIRHGHFTKGADWPFNIFVTGIGRWCGWDGWGLGGCCGGLGVGSVFGHGDPSWQHFVGYVGWVGVCVGGGSGIWGVGSVGLWFWQGQVWIWPVRSFFARILIIFLDFLNEVESISVASPGQPLQIVDQSNNLQSTWSMFSNRFGTGIASSTIKKQGLSDWSSN